MNKYEQLKQVIQKANPEIMELKFGCKIQIFDSTWTIISIIGEENEWSMAKLVMEQKYTDVIAQTRLYSREEIELTRGVEILGRHIRLADVLLADTSLWTQPQREETGDRYLSYGLASTGIKWNLKDDNIDNQSEETKQFLIELLVKQ